MKSKTNLELLELYNDSETKELAKVELESRVGSSARAMNGNIHMILGFIPKRNENDIIVVKRFDGFFELNNSANNGIRLNRDSKGKIIWID